MNNFLALRLLSAYLLRQNQREAALEVHKKAWGALSSIALRHLKPAELAEEKEKFFAKLQA